MPGAQLKVNLPNFGHPFFRYMDKFHLQKTKFGHLSIFLKTTERPAGIKSEVYFCQNIKKNNLHYILPLWPKHHYEMILYFEKLSLFQMYIFSSFTYL